SIATITTSIFNQELFMSNMESVNAELIKFKAKAAEKGKELNCLVFNYMSLHIVSSFFIKILKERGIQND
ncbi:hypothetical protein CYK95_04810, partial [Clostridium perfringens]